MGGGGRLEGKGVWLWPYNLVVTQLLTGTRPEPGVRGE